MWLILFAIVATLGLMVADDNIWPDC
ncbi:gene 1.5 protein [Enterobacteria phage T3]|uniref:Uncharacterized gene 1.5 protein n=3 Tax=Teetrevirus TaxID=2732693 RepID=Y15_BPT3|nr:gene 1.5 protein [Enterobacteria phage T3]YP_009793079.1 hypothetical protein HOS20_gp11 [Enterobacteria phage T7M]P20835.1 RecName: Full=Uncharacterized gene 1.5 protein [Enterobacteria phage T3]AEM44601.1 gp 1.5 [Enterobacteria phage 3/7]AEM44579.1 gp 1.5 [Enterobacteria phage T7M]AFQ97040.1 hypothetical protein [Enterobacteria phage T7M]CAA28701.1 unnamed protein product [Enterobacteria phage T3]CAA35126.1 1.5 [Enterobacteria phage T3]